MEIRLASMDDLPILISFRKQLLIEEGQKMTSNIDDELKKYFEKQLQSENYLQYVAVDHEKIIATGAIQFMHFPPSFTNETGIRGYIANMYTHPDYRGKGIAKKIMERLISESKGRNVHYLFLIASEMGKPLYKKIGFQHNDGILEYICHPTI